MIRTKCVLNASKFIRKPRLSRKTSRDSKMYQLLSSSSPFDQKQTTKSNPYFPHLFQSLYLGPDIGTLPNRVIMGSMHTGLEGHSIPKFLIPLLKPDHDHRDLSAMATYFEERAKGGVGLMVTGGISPNREGWVGPFAAKLTTSHEVDLHREVTDRVHSIRVPSYSNEEGEVARICMQILHAGRYAHHPFAVSASSTKAPISAFKARELSFGQVHSTILDFVNCAVLAKTAGYDGVEIMGSEGYLINQFLVKRTNHRKDDFGGDFTNRMRFAVEIVKQTRQAVGEDFIIIFRLSMLDLVEDGSSWDEIKLLAQAIEDAGATIINTGIGWHEARVPTIQTSVPRATFTWVTKKLRDEGIISIPLCATNRINAPHVGNKVLENKNSDLISMARPFLADSHFMAKSREGSIEDINTCIACNQACLDHAFVGKTASCLVNPTACHEIEMSIQADSVPLDKRLKIGVIGAGPAGLAFATTAATIGHKVVLFDAANEIGGQFNMAKRIPGKEEFNETIRYFNWKLKKLQQKGNISIQLSTEVSHSYMREKQEIDKWIVATGVNPRTPTIPGIDHPNVLSYIDVLQKRKEVGKRVAIIGAGGIGFDVAEYLLHHIEGGSDKLADEVSIDEWLEDWGVDKKNDKRGGILKDGADIIPKHSSGRSIIMLQRKSGKLGKGLGKTTGWIHRATLAKSQAVEFIGSVTYDQIDEQGNLHITIDKGTLKEKKRVLEVDSIVTCAGQTPRNKLQVEASSEFSSKVYTIGGAYEALELDAKRAIDMGTRLALKIHESSVVPGKHDFKSGSGAEEKMFQILKRFM